jgi:hypothetical protein
MHACSASCGACALHVCSQSLTFHAAVQNVSSACNLGHRHCLSLACISLICVEYMLLLLIEVSHCSRPLSRCFHCHASASGHDACDQYIVCKFPEGFGLQVSGNLLTDLEGGTFKQHKAARVAAHDLLPWDCVSLQRVAQTLFSHGASARGKTDWRQCEKQQKQQQQQHQQWWWWWWWWWWWRSSTSEWK